MIVAEKDTVAARRWLLGCTIVTALLALASNGAYHDDDLKHYLFARWVRFDPEYLAHVWGRPGFTMLYALPAQLGWTTGRLLSVVLSAVTAWATFRIAQRLDLRKPAWAIPLLYVQPLFLHLSFTTLTETPAAMYLALATWALLADHRRTSAVVFSLVLLTRHEAVVLLPLWAWALLANGGAASGEAALQTSRSRSQTLVSLAALFWAPIAYNVVTYLAFGYWPATVFSRPDGATHYGQGTPLTFVLRFIVMAGPVVATLFLAGFHLLWPDRRARPMLIGVALYVVMQTALYMHQAYATGGYARFLVPLSPWCAVIALAGLHEVASGLLSRCRTWFVAALVLWICVEIEQVRNPIEAVTPYWMWLRLAVVALLTAIVLCAYERTWRIGVVIVVLAMLGPLVGRAAWPHRLRFRERSVAAMVDELRSRDLLTRPICSANDWPYYFADAWYPARHPPVHEQMAKATPGSLFIWESRYAPSPDANIQLDPLRKDPRWKEIAGQPPDAQGFAVYVFERSTGLP